MYLTFPVYMKFLKLQLDELLILGEYNQWMKNISQKKQQKTNI